MGDRSQQHRAWASSGAMALTGRPDGPPLVAPAGIVDRMRALGAPIGVDVLPLLVERAAIAGLTRQGATSSGGASRLLPARDGWIAATLARPDDVELIPAWLEVAPAPQDPWPAVSAAVAERAAADVVDRGALLGLPVAVVAGHDGDAVRATALAAAPGRARRDQPLVVDLSALWAGPLCARLLGERGMRVVKVEAADRPDGARRGPPEFYALLHDGHEEVTVDFRSADGVAQLRRLLLTADVVVEASRPRALEQLGIDAEDVARAASAVWVSITGYGRDGDHRHRVAFGDDAAAGAGLVAWDDQGPCFVADAVADPLAGVAAAAAVVAALDAGGAWLLDVALAGVAANVAAGAAGRWRAGDPDEAVAPAEPRCR